MKIDNNILLTSRNLKTSSAGSNKYIMFKGATDSFVRNSAKVLNNNYTDYSKKLTELFNKDIKKLPKHLEIIFSQSNNSLLSFTKSLSGGKNLKVTKKAAEEKGKRFFYIAFKELKNGIEQENFAVDIMSGKLIKLDREGKVKFINGLPIEYPENSTDSKYFKYQKKLEEYYNAVFNEANTSNKENITKALKVEIGASVDRPEQKRVWRINNAPYDTISQKSQEDLAVINEKLILLSKLINVRRGISKKIIQLKSDYEPLIYINKKQKSTTFKYRNLESLSVLHKDSNPRYTRIVRTNSNGIETHILIEDNKKVVSNLNEKRPFILPEKFRYMTKKEIFASDVEKYITFLRQQVSDYYDYIYNGIGGAEVKHRTRFTNPKEELDTLIDESAKKIQANIDNLKNNVKERAENDADEFLTEYFNALYEKLDTLSNEKLGSFVRKFQKFIENFTKTESK